MSSATFGLRLIACLMVLSGCGRATPAARTGEDTAQSSVTEGTEEPAESLPRPAPLPPSADTSAPGADPTQARRVPAPSVKADSLPLVSIPDLIASNAWVGERVRVRGTCIGYSRVLAAGPQPQTRSDWQLVTDSTAIWVVGPYPPGCAGTTPADAPATFVVEVAEDTPPALGARPVRPRRYLLYAPLR